MKQLNGDWRGRPRPTDVLAFSLLEGEDAEHRGALLGDVVIGVETAARQARQRRRSLDEEVARLLIHGTLHLLGHDHQRESDTRVMRTEERRLWREIRDPSGRAGSCG
jgi:probable rRNA maturation factor